MDEQSRRLQVLAGHLGFSQSHGAEVSTPRHSLLVSTLSSQHTKGGGARALPVVIGAMVLDVKASCGEGTQLQRGTTAPGKVRYIHGGVARNVADCMASLGAPPLLISVVGLDAAGEALLAHWRTQGLPTHGVRQVVDVATPVVSAVFDQHGEMSAAVADVSTLEQHLTPQWVGQFARDIQTAPVVMLDANLSPAVLALASRLAAEAGVPVWFEPVSVAKSVRATPILHQVAYVSPNEDELIAMAAALGGPPRQQSALALARLMANPRYQRLGEREKAEAVMGALAEHVRAVIGAGVSHVLLTLGALGAVLSFARGSEKLRLDEEDSASCARKGAKPARENDLETRQGHHVRPLSSEATGVTPKAESGMSADGWPRAGRAGGGALLPPGARLQSDQERQAPNVPSVNDLFSSRVASARADEGADANKSDTGSSAHVPALLESDSLAALQSPPTGGGQGEGLDGHSARLQACAAAAQAFNNLDLQTPWASTSLRASCEGRGAGEPLICSICGSARAAAPRAAAAANAAAAASVAPFATAAASATGGTTVGPHSLPTGAPLAGRAAVAGSCCCHPARSGAPVAAHGHLDPSYLSCLQSTSQAGEAERQDRATWHNAPDGARPDPSWQFLPPSRPALAVATREQDSRHPPGVLRSTLAWEACSHRQGTDGKAREAPMRSIYFPALPARVVNTSGAGDSLVGGTLAGLVAGRKILPAVALGLAAARSTVQSEMNVPLAGPLGSISEDADTILKLIVTL